MLSSTPPCQQQQLPCVYVELLLFHCSATLVSSRLKSLSSSVFCLYFSSSFCTQFCLMVVVVGLAVYSVQSVYVRACVRACEYCIIVCTVVNETAAAAEADGRWDVTSVRYITNRRYVRTLMRWNAMLQCASANALLSLRGASYCAFSCIAPRAMAGAAIIKRRP